MSPTEMLAIWGAVTGTIGTAAGLLGLWLRFRQHGLDKPKLICEATFGFDSPGRPIHKITVRSVGRRPVTLDGAQYFNIPRIGWHRFTKTWQHSKGRWVWKSEMKQKIKLCEGEKTELSIFLPENIFITDIYKAKVVDQTGKAWPVKWPPKSKLEQIATHEILDEFKEENQKRVVEVTGHRLGERYFLETKFNTKPGRTGVPCGRGFWFFDLRKYQEKLQDVRSVQINKFLAAEVEEIH